MNGPKKLSSEDAREISKFFAADPEPGTPLPPRMKARMEAVIAEADEHRKTAPEDCDCIQCWVDRVGI
jgi:hypothetical protein